jgi:inhibitor of KinA
LGAQIAIIVFVRIERRGESAFILRDLEVDPARYARFLNQLAVPGLEEAVCAYSAVGLYVGPTFDLAALPPPSEAPPLDPGRHVIPVCYDLGEDLAACAAELGMSPEEVIRAHTSAEYRCFALGFSPGFAYLGYLPAEISGLSRLATPRTRVPAGSVGVTGRQTAVYPSATPGGWRLIGRTPLRMADEEGDYCPIAVGDIVVFEAITPSDYDRSNDSARLRT